MDTPITEAQMRQIAQDYIAPAYIIAGGALAALIILLAFLFVFGPFLRHFKYYSKGRRR